MISLSKENQSEYISPAIKQLFLPGVAGSLAVLFSHPMDLVKTRLQLDNEMAKRGASRHYTGIFNCLSHNWNNHGIRGIQRGVSYGILREFFFSSARIGSFEPTLVIFKKLIGTDDSAISSFERYVVGQTVGFNLMFKSIHIYI
jgi:hypothetical protein